MKKILVTGGTGFIGSAIVKKLLEQNYSVRVIDNNSRESIKYLKEFKNNIEFVNGDIRDFNKVNRSSKGMDMIIHLAYVNGTKFFYEKPGTVLSVGVKGMLNVLDSAREQGVPELMLASSSEVYQTPPKVPTPEDVPYFLPTPFNPRYSYAGGKIISELMSLYIGKEFLKRVVIFRPHNVYGPNMGKEHVIPELLTKIINSNKLGKALELQIQGTGKETRSFIYIDDFIDALLLLLKKGKNQEIYNIGTENEITIKNLIKTMTKVTNTKIIIKPSPRKEGSTMRRCPDISKILELGFNSKVSLNEGLLKTFLWYNENH